MDYLELVDDGGVLPADGLGKTLQNGNLTHGLDAQDTESIGDDDALHSVVWGRNTLIGAETAQSLGSTIGLVGQHATDHTPEDASRGTVMERTVTGICAG